jgi:hypothetical protein
MQRHRRLIPRCVSRLLIGTICSAAALTLLLAAPNAMSQGAGQAAPTASDSGNPFSRWFRMPSAATVPATTAPTAAAPATAQPVQRVRKVRTSRSKPRTKPVTARAAPAQEQKAPPQQPVAEPDWPNAEANVGGPLIVPLTIKTVRQQVEPEPETPIVLENEISDIDRAAQPALAESSEPAAPPPASTDGRASAEFAGTTGEPPAVFAMSETIKSIVQLAWLEPLLLVFAGVIATISAVRLFA